MPTWAKVLIGLGIAASTLVVLMCAGLIYLDTMSPQTRALAGSQLTQRDVKTIRALGLLEDDERIKYFYSDGFLSIEQGMYFFTDRKIVLYARSFDPPLTTVTYDEVVDITSELSDTWIEDGTIWLELADDTYVAMPIASEAGADEYFLSSLVETWRNAQQAASAE